ncbi:MAG: hypothetical protein AB7I59_03365 [Geminicoccaceae bacterium]
MRLMLACAEICRISAYFMQLGTEFHKRTLRGLRRDLPTDGGLRPSAGVYGG